ncbi:MAG: Alginate biosynthesis protein AlgA [Gemmatimonadaceae bacterium]|nr:Alginate biosynthesis protein AlgA [Gemmatimonadaceae bacterium]
MSDARRDPLDPRSTANGSLAGAVDATESFAALLTAEDPAAAPGSESEVAIWAVVLAGGIGSRFWPLSSSHRPKQLLTLLSERPLIAETIDHLHPLIPSERVLVVTSRDIAPAIAAALPSVPARNILVEPEPSGTAAALAWGATEIRRRAGPEAICCGVHADIAIGFGAAFHDTLRSATRLAAQNDVLVGIGVPISRPEPGFGYVVTGEAADSTPSDAEPIARRVLSFVEKPDAERAAYLQRRGALWHSGIFAWRARVLLEALAERTPEVASGLPLLARGDHEGFMQAIASISIERGLFERCHDMIVVPGDFGWDDVGTWASLRRARELDDDGNGVVGSCSLHDATGNVVHAEASTVVLYGVSGLLVVSLNGLTFVTTLSRATDLRAMLDSLPEDLRKPNTAPPV